MSYRFELSLEHVHLVLEALEAHADNLERSAARGYRWPRERQELRDAAQVYRHLIEELRLQKEDQDART